MKAGADLREPRRMEEEAPPSKVGRSFLVAKIAALFTLGIAHVVATAVGKWSWLECGTGLLVWTLFYDTWVCLTLRRGEWFRSYEPGTSWPRAVTWVGVAKQLLVDCLFLLLIAGSLGRGAGFPSSLPPFAGPASRFGADSFRGWWVGSWNGMGPTTRVLCRQFYFSVFGYEFKDVWAEGSLSFPFVLHHSAVCVGVLLCLSLPSGVGLVTLNGLLAEIGSGTFNLSLLFSKGWPARLLYSIAMTASNIFGLFCLYKFIDLDGLDWKFKISYSLLCGLLVILRFGGLFVEMRGWFCQKLVPLSLSGVLVEVGMKEKDKV